MIPYIDRFPFKKEGINSFPHLQFLRSLIYFSQCKHSMNPYHFTSTVQTSIRIKLGIKALHFELRMTKMQARSPPPKQTTIGGCPTCYVSRFTGGDARKYMEFLSFLRRRFFIFRLTERTFLQSALTHQLKIKINLAYPHWNVISPNGRGLSRRSQMPRARNKPNIFLQNRPLNNSKGSLD